MTTPKQEEWEKLSAILQNFAVCRDYIRGDGDDEEFNVHLSFCFGSRDLTKEPIDDLFNKVITEMGKVYSLLLHQARQEILDQVEREVIGEDEDIGEVHKFYRNERNTERLSSEGNEAYDYSGGLINGANALRHMQRQNLSALRLEGKKEEK